MDVKLENELYQIDPVFFEHAIACREGKENEMQTCMAFGCECGSGWFEPIKKFAQKTAILNKLGKDHNVKFVCDQLKEKFGTFTCYYGCRLIDEEKSVDNQQFVDILSSMLDEANKTCEEECWNTCEWCGTKGTFDGRNLITTSGWISRICKKCARQKEEDSTKRYDEIHNQPYVPRITWLHDGFFFLNPAHFRGFEYKGEYYNSIIEAFFVAKDPIHTSIYKDLCNLKEQSPYMIEKIAFSYNHYYEDTEADYNLMKDIIKAKFSHHFNNDLLVDLLETEGKNIQYMGRHHNNILGHCVCDECKEKEHKDLYSKMLMEVREELIAENKKEESSKQ